MSVQNISAFRGLRTRWGKVRITQEVWRGHVSRLGSYLKYGTQAEVFVTQTGTFRQLS
jgi:hypothetical protein